MAAGSISSLSPARASVTLMAIADDGVRVGQSASIQVRPSQVIFGRVARIDVAPSGESITAELEFPDELPPDVLGERVGALIEVGEVPDVVFFERPAQARPDSDGPIFLLEADGEHARRVNVHFGRLAGSLVEIVSGLSEGDMVIATDMSKWARYDRVRLR
jgi:HlyD family secretion protein